MKPLLIALAFLIPLTLPAQIRHQGEIKDGILIGTHEWFNAQDQKIAEVNYSPSGHIIGFKTWDTKGLLIDDEHLPAQRRKVEHPALEYTYTQEGLGFLIVHGRAEPDAPKAQPGERVSVHYEGSLQDGTVFDETYSGKKPYRYKFQTGAVIPGFDQAVSMLRVGEEGYFIMPHDLAYGDQVMGIIPPFSKLTYRIKLVDLN